MTYNESIPLAKSLAEQALSKGFDVEAFIILTLLDKNKDDVPDSQVDNKISDMYNLFLLYVENHDIKTLSEFLRTNVMMINELYHSTYSSEERDKFKEYFNSIASIISSG